MTIEIRWRSVLASSIAALLLSIPYVPAHADFATDACDEFEQLALTGNANAQVETANCYIIGYGRESDYEVAEDWLVKAIEAGSKKAEVTLAALILFKSKDEPRFGLAVAYLQYNIRKPSRYHRGKLLYRFGPIHPVVDQFLIIKDKSTDIFLTHHHFLIDTL